MHLGLVVQQEFLVGQCPSQRLPIEPVSQASANQRAGRCGRVAEGVAIRLFSQADYLSRPRFTEPEILRTSLASVILQMASLGLGAVEDFPFLDVGGGATAEKVTEAFKLMLKNKGVKAILVNMMKPPTISTKNTKTNQACASMHG